MIYLNDALDTLIGSKVALVRMRYFQWYTTIFEVQTNIVTLKNRFLLINPSVNTAGQEQHVLDQIAILYNPS